jgi:hypothetical protein
LRLEATQKVAVAPIGRLLHPTLTVFKKEHLIGARGVTLIAIDPGKLKALAESRPR